MTATSEAGPDEPGPCAADGDGPPSAQRDEWTTTAQPVDSTGADVLVSLMPGVGGAGVDTGWLEDRLAAAAQLLAVPVERAAVLIVGEPHMSQLHRRHMGIAEGTDVLTFPASAPGQPIDVDIAVSVDEAARQAQAHGHGVANELLLYALHGLLHCAGYDDGDEKGFRAMHDEEDRILDEIGVGVTFAAKRRDRGGAMP